MENFEEMQEENVDGTSVIVELQDDVYLTVNPPKASGKHVTFETIKQQLIDKQISSPIDFEMVKKAVEMCKKQRTCLPSKRDRQATSSYRSGEPIKISSAIGEKVKLPEIPQEEKQPVLPQDRDAFRQSSGTKANISKIARKIKESIGIGRVDITISEDEIEVYITVHFLPKKNKVGYIIEQLRKKGVVYGIEEGKIFDVIRNNLFHQKVMVARGKAPIEGKNAELICNFDINREKGPKIEQKGNIDYYYLDSASYVHKDQVLVEKKPPVPAEMGISVKGNRLEPERPGGEDIPLPADGNTVVISEDGTKLLAAIDGYLYFSDGKFKIGNNYMVVKGNVDASIGKIDFHGNVFITGNVLTAFAVEASGNIEIQGYVHETSLNSKEGNIIVHQDIYKANVRAIGDIRIKMAKEAVIDAKGDVIIDGDLFNCVVTAEKNVFVNGEKGIVGGTVIAGAGITVNNVGSPDGVPTIVKIVEEDSKLFLLEYKIKDASERLDRLIPKLTTNNSKKLLLLSIEEYMAEKKRVQELKCQKQELLESKLLDSSRNSDQS